MAAKHERGAADVGQGHWLAHVSPVVVSGLLEFGSLIAFSLLGWSLPASAATSVSLFLTTSGTGTTCYQVSPCETIQDAIAVATGGSCQGDIVTINVAAGTPISQGYRGSPEAMDARLNAQVGEYS